MLLRSILVPQSARRSLKAAASLGRERATAAHSSGLRMPCVLCISAAFFRLAGLGPGSELIEPRPCGVEARLRILDDVANALQEQFGLLPQALEFSVAQITAGECGFVLVEIELQGVELGADCRRFR